MVKPIAECKRKRLRFGHINEVLQVPNLIEIQRQSFDWFVNEGLAETFRDISPIQDFTGNLVLEFLDHQFGEPKYTVDEAKEKDATYSAPLKVKVRLVNKETGEVKEQEVFMGDFPLMTENGTIIYNGAERVVVSQLVRSPGAYYHDSLDTLGHRIFTSTLIPNRGAWLEMETDTNDVVWARVDRTRKIPVTVLLRALGLGQRHEIVSKFGENARLSATFDRDSTENLSDGLLEIYKRLRPGEPPTVESAKALLNSLFFDPRRYDLAHVGRYKLNKKLSLRRRVINREASETIIATETLYQPETDTGSRSQLDKGQVLVAAGEVLVEKGQRVTREIAERLEQAGVNQLLVERATLDAESKSVILLLGNGLRRIDWENLVRTKRLAADVLSVDGRVILRAGTVIGDGEIATLTAAADNDALPERLIHIEERRQTKEVVLTRRYNQPREKHLTRDDIFSAVNYLLSLLEGLGKVDDIDHLGNRRLRSVGELLQNAFRIGLSRMERVVKERMTIQDVDVITPQALINIRPVVASIKEFFGSSQLSQFMDQTNPLAELAHKRRLSALGPGGLSRERAGVEVRDVHFSHYGRICPIETPEGPNVGLIGNLSTFARVNSYGFMETPYRVVKSIGDKTYVTLDLEYLTADEEDEFVIAQANAEIEPAENFGLGTARFTSERTTVRHRTQIKVVPVAEVDYMDVSPKQVFSVPTILIPFLEHDEAGRALMGANMMKQAVPLLRPEAPLVGTGMEFKAALDSGSVVAARRAGKVIRVSAKSASVETADGSVDTYKLMKFVRSNQGTCISQKPIVAKGQEVHEGEPIADGPATDLGEIALGRNVLCAVMPWGGYNFEDAILISERLVRDDVFTSIHIEEYEAEARDTKLGPEEITADIPNVGEDMIRDLDERGIVRIGAEVRTGDILVGKVTPKGETELTAEERLLRAIFGEKAREVRDTSARVPHGESGRVVDVKVFSRDNKDELPPGVNMLVRVYVAQKRKISEGDKMAGRHGNKGVISRILPDEDMPFLPDGRAVDIVLNPLGVPSRMNIGQVLEMHLGMAAKALGLHCATPVFDGATEKDIEELLAKAGLRTDGKSMVYDGRTGERFDNPVAVGYVYMLKLFHLVDDKIHARSTGPYSLVTQQPLGGKAQFGGQRFGEMEVWALEAYGAAYTLQELLTVKSDDVVGRVKTYEAIVKGENIPEPGVPESFKVLIKELQSLGMNVKILSADKQEIEMRDTDEDVNETVRELKLNIEGDEDFADIRPRRLVSEVTLPAKKRDADIHEEEEDIIDTEMIAETLRTRLLLEDDTEQDIEEVLASAGDLSEEEAEEDDADLATILRKKLAPFAKTSPEAHAPRPKKRS
ncbi:MAG: DNA-directed RNA polymerase subunit beta [Firmicutes bacterium]|nr:DNA-directed RNA polymerase subunit beta [Dethiobacter sp.]MBS3889124.1 DNA-directed RNA polymerase subunit beta [Bacillota bacterium]MBS4054058.1 DNA-directed RNA polymerase subunit beta [Thermaerobacter sp.]